MTVVPPWSLNGRPAVITGFGAGIGRATATAFARAGARIAGLDIDAQYGERAARELGAEGAEAAFISCDTGDAGAIESAFATIADTIGPVDILVNNAGAGSHTRPEDLSLAEWEHVMAVSITGYAMAAREAGRAMIRHGRGGSIVNVSSIAGLSALGRGNFAYSVAKAGVNQLTRELAVEWAGHGIRVNAVAPCQVRTEAISSLLADQRFDGGAVEQRFIRGIPLGRARRARRDRRCHPLSGQRCRALRDGSGDPRGRRQHGAQCGGHARARMRPLPALGIAHWTAAVTTRQILTRASFRRVAGPAWGATRGSRRRARLPARPDSFRRARATAHPYPRDTPPADDPLPVKCASTRKSQGI